MSMLFCQFTKLKRTRFLLVRAIRCIISHMKENTNIDVYYFYVFMFYLLDWNRVTNSLIALMLLLPPTARGRKLASREKASNLIRKLIDFVQVKNLFSLILF